MALRLLYGELGELAGCGFDSQAAVVRKNNKKVVPNQVLAKKAKYSLTSLNHGIYTLNHVRDPSISQGIPEPQKYAK